MSRRDHFFPERPMGLVPLDDGRIGYRCKECDGEYTTTDAGTCLCDGRDEDCAANLEAWKKYQAYKELVRT